MSGEHDEKSGDHEDSGFEELDEVLKNVRTMTNKKKTLVTESRKSTTFAEGGFLYEVITITKNIYFDKMCVPL
ncbi:hypothetical protein DPMN_115529 [Dreissena polymorpha]|uniref:Uncharacterized protein n=1 Tax=Dreissena polymorpha TaxID=45954 RepID=A0A9D4QSJ7_DREPO|nr:hypothetical protein DPMN_115529 [Dreissena polymorpha]